MKKTLLIALLIVVGLASCGKKEKAFRVNVNMKNTDENTLIYLNKVVENQPVVIDSAYFKDETVSLKAPFDDAQLLYLLNIKGTDEYLMLFPENQDVKVTGDLHYLSSVDISGGDAQNRFSKFYSLNNIYDTQFEELLEQRKDAYINEDMELYNNTVEKINQLIEEQENNRIKFIKENGDLFVSHYLLNEVKQDFTLDELQDFVSGFSTESVYTKELNDYITQLEKVSIGHQCPDFTLKTVDGQEVTLSEYYKENKLTLIDFWASWCGPCRGENPYVVAAYEKYHEFGFNVLSVSVDQDVDLWTEAVEKDGLIWTNVRDADGSVSETYLVYYIPSNFLVDDNGIILEKDLRGEKLEDFISNRFQVK